MNYQFFAVFTIFGAAVTTLYVWPVLRRQLGLMTLIYAIGGLLGAFLVPQESTDIANAVVILCFISFSAVLLMLEKDSQLTGLEDGRSPKISRTENAELFD